MKITMSLPRHVTRMIKKVQGELEGLSVLLKERKTKSAVAKLIAMAKEQNNLMRKHHLAPRVSSDDQKVPACSGHLCSVQVNLSRLKSGARRVAKSSPHTSKALMDALEKHYLEALCLTTDESSKVRTHRDMRVKAAGENVVSIPGDLYVRQATELLKYIIITNGDRFEAVVCLAILTGRRSSEILRTISVRQPTKDDPKDLRKTHEQYWTCMCGFLKHKSGVKIKRIIPILAPRKLVVQGIKYIRERMPSKSVSECNSRYSTQINRAVKRLCPELNNLHAARRLYALLCHHYFRKEIMPGKTMSLPRTVSYVLGHTNLTKTSITYMNIDLKEVGSIDFTKDPNM